MPWIWYTDAPEWPPKGYSRQDLTPEEEARLLLANGASTFRGLLKYFEHAPGSYKFFAIMESECNGRSDCAILIDEAFAAASLPLFESEDSLVPWKTLEQPCMRYAYGKSPGTTTLAYYIAKAGQLWHTVPFEPSNDAPNLPMAAILTRLYELQEYGIELEHAGETHHNLYQRLIFDPSDSPQYEYPLESQIIHLITVLGNPDWIDFSDPDNQTVGVFIEHASGRVRRHFYLQLVLAIELYLRLTSPRLREKRKIKFCERAHPKIMWATALAHRWLQTMSTSGIPISGDFSEVDLISRRKSEQKDGLRNFARTLGWPNMAGIEYVLSENDPKEEDLERRSPEAMSWFTGVILPGQTFPFVLMKALISCDRDIAGSLDFISHRFPNCGFQYHGTIYLSSQTILGKVFGAFKGVNEVAGWIGPCRTFDSSRHTEGFLLNQMRPWEPIITKNDVRAMNEISDPLGFRDVARYPLSDYEMLFPDFTKFTDTIRLKGLDLRSADFDEISLGARHEVRTNFIDIYNSFIIFTVGDSIRSEGSI